MPSAGGMNMKLRIVALIVALCLGMWPFSVRGNGVVRDSLGAVSSGRGGANTAHEDNLSIIHDNPAGLVWLGDDWRAEYGSDFLLTDVRYRDPDDSDRSNRNFFYLPQLAVAGRVPNAPFPIVLGLSASFPGGYGTRYKLEHGIFGRETYRSSGLLLKVLPTISMKIGEYVSIGGGVGLGYSQAAFKAPYTFNAGPLAGQSARIDLDTDAFAVTGNFGIQVRPNDRLTIGAAFVSQTMTKQEGDFDVDVTGGPLAGFVTDPTASYDADFRLRWPRSATLGASYRFDFGRVSAESGWFHWSDAFDEFHFNLSDGDNGEFDALAGTTPNEVFPLDWRDSYTIRLGYEHYLGEGVLRLGYIYNLNPVPNRTLTPLLPGILEHTVSVGYGHDFGQFQLDVAYQYAVGSTQKVGQSELAGTDFDNSELRAQAHWFFLSLSATF